jgi:hypothetical protein
MGMVSKKPRLRDIHAGEVLDERPGEFIYVAEWFETLPPERLHGVWVATLLDAIVDGDVRLHGGVKVKHFAAALVAVRDRLPRPKVSGSIVKFDDDSGND